jgi:S-DNA-T family DNA segregation ATPase FtsK/SpoIIIE
VATTTRKPPASRKPAAAKRKPPAKKKQQRGESPVVAALKRADTWGVALALLGVLSGLGTWFDLAGPAGRALEDGADALVGGARFGVPIAMVWLGIVLIHDWRTVEAHDARRALIGFGLIFLAGVGLADIVTDAGGAIGRGIGGPLERLLAVWGASIVLVLIGVAGVLVLTKTTVQVAVGHSIELARPLARGVRGGVSWLTTVGQRDEAEDDAASTDDVAAEADAPTGVHIVMPEPIAAAEPEPDEDDVELHDVDLHVFDDGEPESTEQLAMTDLGPAAEPPVWKLPPTSLLARSETQSIDQKIVEEQGRTLEAALAAHGVETRLIGATVGPTVTRFELELGPGVKVNRVTSLHKDIAYAMASPDVRILAPIPGRSAIGVEVPNVQRALVAVGDILTSDEAKRATHPCEVALGRDISGRAVMANLAQMPHILIAGATGAGKSSCINSLITSLLVRTTPDQLRMILVDPKRVELGQYNGLPHLLTPVVVNPKKAANALSWAVKEMERRYDLLSEVGVRDITGYNAAYDRGELVDVQPSRLDAEPVEYKRLPFIVIVVDELNDLMMVAARDVEESICRIAQMARAVGIHLVIATQRPSVNVITGVIKANIPARLAFAVSTMADSRVILDQGGAERLVGKGDMLLLGPASSHPRRIQGAWVGEDEVRKVVGHWRRQSHTVVYDDHIAGDDAKGGGEGLPGGSTGDADDDDLLWQAMELIVRSQLGSTSMLQRKLKVGFARAGRLMDLLEQKGVVGPSTGSKARDVLMTPEELDDLLATRG